MGLPTFCNCVGIVTLTAEKARQKSNKMTDKIHVVNYTALNYIKLRGKKFDRLHMVRFCLDD